MKLKRNKVVRIKGNVQTPSRYWGRLARISTLKPARNSYGEFDGTMVVVHVDNRITPLEVPKSALIER